MNKHGKKIVPFKYNYVERVDRMRKYDWAMDGLHIVCMGNFKAHTLRYGYIDTSGAEVIPPVYEDAKGFCKGLAAVKQNDKWGFIDKTGKTVIPFEYDEVTDFWEERDFLTYNLLLPAEDITQVKINNGWIWINRKNEKVQAPLEYDRHKSYYMHNLKIGITIIQAENGLWGVLEEGTGKTVIPVKYGSLDIAEEHLNLAELAAKTQTKQMDTVDESSGKIICVKRNDKWGYTDKTGKMLIPFKFEDARNFSEGLAAVCLNGRWKFIDCSGKTVLRLEKGINVVRDFYKGVAEICEKGAWSIDKQGHRAELYW